MDFKPGDTVIKYGEDIGKIVADIDKGEHVQSTISKQSAGELMDQCKST